MWKLIRDSVSSAIFLLLFDLPYYICLSTKWHIVKEIFRHTTNPWKSILYAMNKIYLNHINTFLCSKIFFLYAFVLLTHSKCHFQFIHLSKCIKCSFKWFFMSLRFQFLLFFTSFHFFFFIFYYVVVNINKTEC